MTAPARAAAHAVLRAVHSGKSDLPQAQARARDGLSDRRDQSLAAEIATGTLRMRNALDCLLGEASSRPLTTLDPDVLDLLRAAAYQLTYLDRVPSHAVVHDTVTLTRTLGRPRAAGFVNAVLRSLTRSRPLTKALPDRPGGAEDRGRVLDYLNTTLSHPRWLAERWLDRFGFDAAERWMRFNNSRAPIALRVNTLQTDPATLTADLRTYDVDVAPGRWSSRTLVITRGNPLTTPLAATGQFLIQDEASQLVADLVAARPGEYVFDACAAPGGKTVAIAGAMTNTGVVVSSDLRPRRLALLSHTLSLSGCRNTRIVCCDARLPLPFSPRFDWVLVDAPCSGLGTLRRDPDIRWRRQPADLVAMAAAQSAMLTAATAVVSVGGRLVYATCSSEPEENQQVVRRLLDEHPEFTVEKPDASHFSSLIDADGFLQTFPHRDGLNSFFAAVLRRRRDSDTSEG